jgi:hypothetical protein
MMLQASFRSRKNYRISILYEVARSMQILIIFLYYPTQDEMLLHYFLIEGGIDTYRLPFAFHAHCIGNLEI